ncbi:hypothetical protein CR513_09112, partial [Mucuna pruriens]
MEMTNLSSKLKLLKQFKVSYNAHNDKWSTNELISHERKKGCSETRLKVLTLLRPLKIRKGKTLRIHEKSQSLDIFKSFKAEVELQLGKKIKAIKSDCGGKYYEYGIVLQYTMPGKPSMNSVTE